VGGHCQGGGLRDQGGGKPSPYPTTNERAGLAPALVARC
jgi:hypothetical protein